MIFNNGVAVLRYMTYKEHKLISSVIKRSILGHNSIKAAFYTDIHGIHNLLSKILDVLFLVVMFIVHILYVVSRFMIQRFNLSHSYSPSSFKCRTLGVVGHLSSERLWEPMLSRIAMSKVSAFRLGCYV